MATFSGPLLAEATLISLTEDDGLPPRLEYVINDYQDIRGVISWAHTLAVLTRFVLRPEEQRPPQISHMLEELERFPDEEGYLASDGHAPAPTYFFGQYFNQDNIEPRTTARISGATHSNPLETIMIISGTVLVMTILSMLFSRKRDDVIEAHSRRVDDQIEKLVAAITDKSVSLEEKKLLAPLIKAISITQRLPEKKVIFRLPGAGAQVG
jgi:hypothetical protein